MIFYNTNIILKSILMNLRKNTSNKKIYNKKHNTHINNFDQTNHKNKGIKYKN